MATGLLDSDQLVVNCAKNGKEVSRRNETVLYESHTTNT